MIQPLQRGKDRLSVGRCGQQGMRVYRLVLLCGPCRAIAVTGRVQGAWLRPSMAAQCKRPGHLAAAFLPAQAQPGGLRLHALVTSADSWRLQRVWLSRTCQAENGNSPLPKCLAHLQPCILLGSSPASSSGPAIFTQIIHVSPTLV